MVKAAAQVMIVSVYVLDEAFCTVRFHAGLRELGITSGNSATKVAVKVSAIAVAVPAKAQPSQPARLPASAASSAAAATTDSTVDAKLPCAAFSQISSTTASAATGRPIRPAKV